MKNTSRSLMACLLTVGMVLTVPLALTVPGDVYAAPGGGGGGNEKGEKKCSDLIDNDNDGDIDCADSGCFDTAFCQGTTTSTTSTTSTTTSTGVVVTTTGVATTTTTTGVTTTTTAAVIGATTPKNQFNIMMNYELGMHCTGFEFSYCCVLPPYNSILAQVVKTQKNDDFPTMMEADHTVGLDFLGRPTVVRDKELDDNGNFKKYMLTYSHDAQDRNGDPNGKPQTSTLISAVEGNSLLMWNTIFDAADVDAGNALQYTDGTENCSNGLMECNGSVGVVKGDGDWQDSEDNYANAWLNHFYIYQDLEGSNPDNSSLEIDKIRLGLPNAVHAFPTILPDNSGPAFHPMGPGSTPGLNNVLTFSTDHGTVVFTQMKLLENLPVMLTSPRIWEALGLPLTPFEDTIDFFGDPGLVDEDSLRPYVFMRAQMHEAVCGVNGCTPGDAVLDNGVPVTGFGTAPIDIPNCERCHSAFGGQNAGNANHPLAAVNTQLEIDFWNTYYSIDTGAGDSDWYSRLKGAAVSMLTIHDIDHGTSFMANYPTNNGIGIPQNYRSGHESVICQRCHADNVIATVKSATCGPDNDLGLEPCGGTLIPALTEAIHYNHRNTTEDNGPIVFNDSHGRDGGCQGCHPAHRSDGSMAGYPITEDGDNAYAAADNRDAAGGCFVGRDVHSNPNKDGDGAGTPEHLNGVGKWLSSNMFQDASPDGPSGKGIWCTNCHSQLGQELWKAENVVDAVNALPGDPGNVREPSANASLADVAAGLGISTNQAISWLDPKTTGSPDGVDNTHAIWAPDPGLCDYVAGAVFQTQPQNPAHDGAVVTIEVSLTEECSTPINFGPVDCTADYPGTAPFWICLTADGDGDVSVNALDFCTTPDCVAAAQATLPLPFPQQAAVPVPFSAATDGRDHWLSAGEPHCADCHAAPYVEQSGNINAFPPFNYPRKSSLFRYSRGHQDITCQGCHESTHGLYPVTPLIDTTSYAQAESMNSDGTHGPLNCSACHYTNSDRVYVLDDNRVNTSLDFRGTPIDNDFDAAISWAHTYTEEADVRDSICLRCHGDNSGLIADDNGKWTNHTKDSRVSRASMDKAEIAQLGAVAGTTDPYNGLCRSCHGDRTRTLEKRGCTTKWKNHLIEGRSAESVWEFISNDIIGNTCGW